MSSLHLLIVALIQGITEFLPISSSGHLQLIPEILNVQDQGLAVDVAAHVGTLCAVLLYFRRDVYDMVTGFYCLCRGTKTPGGTLALYIILATLPVVVAGLALHFLVPEGIRSLHVIVWTTLGFGVLLGWVDRAASQHNTLDHLTLKTALLIGLAQVLALLPGTSRSGITMTAARYFGYDRASAARFSLLLSIPTIIAAGTLSAIELYQSADKALTQDALVTAGLAFIAGLCAIAAMMKWLKSASFAPFVAYRVLLGFLLLLWLYII